MVICAMTLSGCKYYKLARFAKWFGDPETSHEVSVSSDGQTVRAVLKQDTSAGYGWKYYEEGNAISYYNVSYSKDIFTSTDCTTYDFISLESGKSTLYLILTKDGDLDTAKVFFYELSTDSAKKIYIENEGSFLLEKDNKLKKKIIEQESK